MPTRRVIVAVIATALGFGVAVGTVAAVVGEGRGQGDGTAGNTPTPGKSSPLTKATGKSTPKATGNPAPPPKPIEVKLVPGKLKRGENLEPYWDAKTKRVENSTEPWTLATRPSTLLVSELGFVLSSATRPTRMLSGGGPGNNGDVWQLGKGIVYGPVVSSDRTKFAWTVASEEGGDATLFVNDFVTGEVTSKKDVGFSVQDVVGFLGDKVVVAGAKGNPMLVDPNTGGHTVLNASQAYATAPGAGLIAVDIEGETTDKAGNPANCSDILDGPNGKSLWHGCEVFPISFSPDGRYAVITPVGYGEQVASTYTIIDIPSRRPVLTLDADRLGRVRWSEGSTLTVILEVEANEKFSIVECTLKGNCANLVEPAPVDEENPAYVLSSD